MLSRKPTRVESEAFSTAHQNVLLERMEKNIQGLADGHVFLREKLEDMDQKFEARMGRMETDLQVMKGDIADLKLGQSRLEEITTEILQRLKSVENRVAALEARLLVSPPAPIVSDDVAEKIRRLEERVAFLESRVA